MPRFLIAGQRAQFSAFNMQNLLKGRNMAVLGGQFSIFSTRALRRVLKDSHQRTPWVKDSEVEDSLLSLQIKSAGFLTKISATAYAHVGGMTTLRGLDAQQVKWNYGAIDLMWPGQRGDTRGQPFHPNLRLRWFEHFSMVLNIFTRLGFLLLLAGSLSIDAFVFGPLWLIPPLVAIFLNFRVARSMAFAHKRDYLFGVLLVPAEIYMWIRMGHFVRAWLKFFSSQQTDNWAAQAKAERGKGIVVPLSVPQPDHLPGHGERDLAAAAHRAPVRPPRGRLSDPRGHHDRPDRLDGTQGAAALPGVQGMSRYAARRLAVAAVAVCLGATASGCNAFDSKDEAPTPDRVVLRRGRRGVRLAVHPRRHLPVPCRAARGAGPGLRLHALPDQVDAADQRVVPEGRQVLLVHLPGLRPLAEAAGAVPDQAEGVAEPHHRQLGHHDDRRRGQRDAVRAGHRGTAGPPSTPSR